MNVIDYCMDFDCCNKSFTWSRSGAEIIGNYKDCYKFITKNRSVSEKCDD